MVSSQLTGDFDYVGWNIAPQISLTYIREQQKAYVDSNAITIAARNVELGQGTHAILTAMVSPAPGGQRPTAQSTRNRRLGNTPPFAGYGLYCRR